MPETAYPTAEPFVPEGPTLPKLRRAAEGCTGCPLHEGATQTVFGEGSRQAKVLVCLGATAAKALLGPSFKVTKQRAEFVDSDLAPLATGTVHPSSILRAPDDEARHRAYADFVQDLRVIAGALH